MSRRLGTSWVLVSVLASVLLVGAVLVGLGVLGGFPGSDRPSTPSAGFPDRSATGVPDGVSLAPYDGPCTITEPETVIEARHVTCDLRVQAPGLEIRDSLIEGSVGNDENTPGQGFTITDSTVLVGERPGTGIGSRDFTATRVEVRGGNRSINCWSDCTVRDSWVHAQFTDTTGVFHESGVRMGSNATIVGNRIVCDAPAVPPSAACSAGLTGYGDFAPVHDNLVSQNLFEQTTGGTCVYGGSTPGKAFSAGVARVRFVDNTFERGPSGTCGHWATVMAFDADAPGNVWDGNRYTDGSPVQP